MKNNNKSLDYLKELKEKYKNVVFYDEQSFLRSLRQPKEIDNKK